MSLFKNLISDFSHLFQSAEKDVGAFVKALVDSITANGGAVLVTAAANAVAAAETKGGTGAEKLAFAEAAVITTLTSLGIPVVTNAINGAIEAAVAQQKANAAGPAISSTATPSASATAA